MRPSLILGRYPLPVPTASCHPAAARHYHSIASHTHGAQVSLARMARLANAVVVLVTVLAGGVLVTTTVLVAVAVAVICVLGTTGAR